MGIAQHLTAQENDVGAMVADDLIRLHRLGDEANRRRKNIRTHSDGLGNRNLVARTDGHVGVCDVPPSGAVDQVDRLLLQSARQLDRVLNGPALPPPNPCRRYAPSEATAQAETGRTARTVSSRKLMRFSKLPPYSSVRWLERGE